MADQSIEGWQALDHQLRQYQRLSSPPQQTTGNASFSMFKHLPRKVRDQIWMGCFPEPRIVEVRFVGLPFHQPSPRIPSPILHACRESRAKMLESYLPLYRPESTLPTLYINPNIDALFINEYIHKLDKVIPEFSPRILGSLRHLVVESERVLRHPSYSNVSMDKLTKFANLEKLTMSTPPTKPDFQDVVLLSIFPYPLSAHLGGGCKLAEYYNAMRFQLSEEAVSNIRAWSSPDVAQGYSWVSAAIEKVSRDNPDWKVPRIDLKAVERIRKLTGTDGDWASMLDEGLSIGEFELALS